MARPGRGGNVSGMDRDGEPTDPAAAPWPRDAGPEPGWAEAIRQGRKARGDNLRAVFASFGEEDPTPTPEPASEPGPPAPGADGDEGP